MKPLAAKAPTVPSCCNSAAQHTFNPQISLTDFMIPNKTCIIWRIICYKNEILCCVSEMLLCKGILLNDRL
ncbi:hypothetical protein, partial [Oscillibacter ruminantium]|uniref:hypothetical protein n=1 Tax=Oscillibacter ruminantium TaxID=1263547 RepID=UPI00331A1B31